MPQWLDIRIEKHLAVLRKLNLSFDFVEVQKQVDAAPMAQVSQNSHVADRKSLNLEIWCSNDYLAMGQNPLVAEAAINVLKTFGVGSGGGRHAGGTNPEHVKLEREIADLHSREAALLCNSGYAANDAAIRTLMQLIPNGTFVIDELSHASMRECFRRSSARLEVFLHNDVADLRRKLESLPKGTRAVILFESIYGMEGDLAPLRQILEIAEEYDAVTYLDEVHAVACRGPEGAGLAAELGIAEHFTIIQGGLGKAYGAMGGYIAASERIVSAVSGAGASFIFTTSLPPAIAAAGLASMKYLRRSDTERWALQERSEVLRNKLRKNGIPTLGESHIVPVLVGGTEACFAMSDRLVQRGFYIRPITFPAVPHGEARLRITPTPAHTTDSIERLADAITAAWAELGLP
ncbi:5-aminolevulinate synthase [Streptomyces djakartensis]|uniref:5-aminolevulinate synthase n=1 Tax=Streptomyces djakartensis TaxID=68193 RepID=UPI0034DE190E